MESFAVWQNGQNKKFVSSSRHCLRRERVRSKKDAFHFFVLVESSKFEIAMFINFVLSHLFVISVFWHKRFSSYNLTGCQKRFPIIATLTQINNSDRNIHERPEHFFPALHYARWASSLLRIIISHRSSVRYLQDAFIYWSHFTRFKGQTASKK